ncbi:hypothetical protein QM042_01880 [Escherichia coli]|uniref:hypothetical protein n=1 Tax=Escherichia coli TaxID=562 RepID=UPI0039869259
MRSSSLTSRLFAGAVLEIKRPRNVATRIISPWKYRGPECGYTSSLFDKNNQQTTMSGADYCTKRYDSCNARRTSFTV